LSLLDICQTIQDSAIGTGIRESVWTFPIIETIHILALALSVGMIVMLDLRLIGAGMRHAPAGQIMGQLKKWYLAGFGAMVVSGVFLFWSEAAKCYRSNSFRIKLLLLLLVALNAVFFEIVYKPRMEQWETGQSPPTGAKLCGWCSMILWIGVIGFGRWTAYGMK
jgi:uncharacterized protein DUF6644